MNEAVTLVPGQTDAEKAEKYRKELTESLKPVIEILERAKRDGLVVQWNIAADEFGRIRVPFINVTKPL